MSGITAHLILNKRSLAYWINHGEEAEVFFFLPSWAWSCNININIHWLQVTETMSANEDQKEIK